MGKVKAAHALAKIAAVSNPDIAFPGERVGAGAGAAEGWGKGALEEVFFAPRGLCTLPQAWEGAWCCHREDNELEVPGSASD